MMTLMVEGVLLERDAELAVLQQATEAAGGRRGSVVLVSGEAGIGKTALLDGFVARLHEAGGGRARVHRGACDDLLTPRPFGPIRDMARTAGGDLARALADGDRDATYEAFLEALDHPLHVTLVLVEDAHWADDATLDLLRYVIRRVARSRAVLVVTYRDEAIAPEHPWRQLLGGLAGSPVHRLPLRPLSRRATALLVEGRKLDPESVLELTGGNPFYVTELVAAAGTGATTVPATVVDAVLARLGRLSPRARAAAEQLSVVPTGVDSRLARELIDAAALAEAEQGGVLEARPTLVRFRHELARRAVEDALPQLRRVDLHARFLEVLLATGSPDPSRIVHHAVAAADVDRLVEHGPVAAKDATAAGAHRQAAAHYATLLPHLARFDPAERAELLEAHALESYYVGDGTQAVRSQLRATELRRALGDPVALGTNLLWLARHHWWCGHRAEAEQASAEAVTVLEDAGDGSSALAMAYSRRAQLLMLAFDDLEAIPWAERAVALARRLGDRQVLAHALCNLGTSRWQLGDEDGRRLLEESMTVARAAGAEEDVCRSYTNIVWQLLRLHRHEEARRIGLEAIAYAEDVEQLGFAGYLRGTLATSWLETGDLGRAESYARPVMATGNVSVGLLPAATALGVTLTRRGGAGPEARGLLEHAWTCAERSGELQRLGPVAAAWGEHAWCDDEPQPALDRLAQVQLMAEERASQRYVDQLGYWRWKLGEPVHLSSDSGWALQVRGEWDRAARWWAQRGQPYEHALALAESGVTEPTIEALRMLEDLGAAPAARKVRARLRALGARGVPRGPTSATRANPAGLTPRQTEVLELLATGLTNAQIADHLVVSLRTVDHHVSAILQKLGVGSRQEAAARSEEVLSP
jgi:DNA-binding CsgD family transcriptional regulator/tetratricopeptide (TPR) repeat protein